MCAQSSVDFWPWGWASYHPINENFPKQIPINNNSLGAKCAELCYDVLLMQASLPSAANTRQALTPNMEPSHD
jgi:hypothetical protein